MNKKLVLIITDSLGLPRNIPEQVELSNTYVSLLKNDSELRDFDFHQLSLGGGTVNTLYNQASNYYAPINPDIVIVQSGIVDCAPRAFTQIELKLMNLNKITTYISKKYLKPISKKIRKKRGITYTSLQNFAFYAKQFKQAFSHSTVYWLGIIPACEEYEFKVPGIRNNIQDFNQVLKTQYKDYFLELDEISSTGVMSDFHHLNKKGHTHVYKQLKSSLLHG